MAKVIEELQRLAHNKTDLPMLGLLNHWPRNLDEMRSR
jgi:hypothetical protein